MRRWVSVFFGVMLLGIVLAIAAIACGGDGAPGEPTFREVRLHIGEHRLPAFFENFGEDGRHFAVAFSQDRLKDWNNTLLLLDDDGDGSLDQMDWYGETVFIQVFAGDASDAWGSAQIETNLGFLPLGFPAKQAFAADLGLEASGHNVSMSLSAEAANAFLKEAQDIYDQLVTFCQTSPQPCVD